MRILYLLISIILLMTTQAKSQVRPAVPDADLKIVRFYPNPAISFINFEVDKDLNNNKGYSLQIFNFLGKKVYEGNVNAKTQVDLTTFVRGLYIFQLREQDGRIADSGKFQVTK